MPELRDARSSLPAAAAGPQLVHSIIATLCCCMPFGIVALVYSAQVNSKLAAGDVAGAQAASASAKTWVIVSFVAGFVTFGGLGLLSVMQ